MNAVLLIKSAGDGSMGYLLATVMLQLRTPESAGSLAKVLDNRITAC